MTRTTMLPILLLACSAEAEAPSPSPAPAPAPADGATPLARAMDTHFEAATNARNAVIHGDLAGARLWGRGLAERTAPEGMPTAWRPLYAEMQAAAGKVSQAADLPAAAAAVGALAVTCAECHDFTGGGPGHLILPLPPPEIPTGTSDMPLHQWSVDWLWIGLIAKDPAAWSRGADALQEAPFAKRPDAPHSDVGLTQMEQLVHLLPGMADTTDRAAQGQRFGEVITACMMCHAEVTKAGIKPPAP